MKRKLVIEKCKYCPFVQLYFCELENEQSPSNHYFCDGDGFSASIEDLTSPDVIPEWCPLEIDK